jgi:hypothetical protein
MDKTNASNLIITPDSAEIAGAVSYWRASGSISIDALRQAWGDAQLDMKLLRKPPEPETALRRAVLELAMREKIDAKIERRILVRPQQEPSTWAVVEEIVAEGVPPVYTTLEIISFVKDTGPQFYTIEGTREQAAQILSTVMASFSRQSGLYDPSDVTGWLVKLAYKNDAVTLRESGGVYFIPRPAMTFWNKAADIVESVSRGAHKVFRIPAMHNAEAVAAITDAITQEAAQVVELMQKDLGLIGEAALGPRAIKTRQVEAEALLAKLNSYEELLGAQLAVRERVSNLQTNLTVAALMHSEEET